MADTYMVLSTKNEGWPHDSVHLKLVDLGDGTYGIATVAENQAEEAAAEAAIESREVNVFPQLLHIANRQSEPIVSPQYAKGLLLWFTVGLVGTDGAATLFVDHYDPSMDSYICCFQSPAYDTLGTRQFAIYPAGMVDTGTHFGGLQQTPLGSRWRARILVTGTTGWGTAAGACYLF